MAKPAKLTKKQRAFADQLLENPKISATEAAARTYGKPNKEMSRGTAEVIAYENLRKPVVQAYLDIHAVQASDTLMEVMQTSREFAKSGNGAGAQYASTAVAAAKDVLDRKYGKALQQIETRSNTVTINLDLTGTVSE